jgi:DNA-3-methyladenine glycosylase I
MPSSDTSPGRCSWALSDELMLAYHDDEWGVPEHDDRALFELLLLEGFQAGLSWRTILARREGMRAAFDGFEPEVIAGYDDVKVAALLADPRIIRNRAKVAAAIKGAQAYLALVDAHGSFDAWIWGFVGGEPQLPRELLHAGDVPAETAGSRALSKALKKAGFGFCGPTIVYAFMQSAGLVDDHVVGCFRYRGPGGD